MADLQLWLEAVISDYDRRRSVVRVISVEEIELVGAGDNYMSKVKKLVVRAVRGNGGMEAKSFILKQLPAGENIRQLILRDGFNVVEFTSYRDVLSSMELLMNEKLITEDPIWPQLIAMKPYDKILFEDLTATGYRMADRLKGLDFEHCTLVVQNLGLFHAMSLVLKEQGTLPAILYAEHVTLRNRKESEGWIAMGYKRLLDDMEKWGDEWREALEKLKAKLSGFAELILDLLTNKENEFSVLNHGDCWTNNFLFKYNAYTGKPILMKFIDFQISFLGSPAQDLTYFLTASPNLEVRRHHNSDLVRIYHKSLLLNMNRLGVTTVKPPSLEYIENEMKRLTYLRFYIMSSLVAMIKQKPEDTYNLEAILEEAKLAEEKGEILDNDAWMKDIDDGLREIYQITIKEAYDNCTL